MQQKTRVDENFKKKAKELEDKLAIAKAKEREQITMQKQSEMQKQRIKGLESEIEKIKTQKVIMMKQMKEESEKHRKWK
jgi:kinesin family protein 4/21/27